MRTLRSFLLVLLALLSCAFLRTTDVQAYPYTFTDSDEHLIVTLDDGGANLPPLLNQPFEITNDSGTRWWALKMRLDGKTPYGDFCCEGFADYVGSGTAIYYDADSDPFGRAEMMPVWFLFLPDGSTVDFEVDILHLFPEGLTQLDIYGDPLVLTLVKALVSAVGPLHHLATFDSDAAFMLRHPFEIVNMSGMVWTQYRVYISGRDSLGADFPFVRFEDLDGDGKVYLGPGTAIVPSAADKAGGNELWIYNLQIAPGDTLRFRSDIAGYSPAGLAEMTIEGQALADLSAVGSDDTPLRNDFSLKSSPNPFNALTTLEFFLQSPQHATLEVYDMSGRLVRVLVAQDFSSGLNQVEWDGRGNNGLIQASGTYFARIKSGPSEQVIPIVLVK